MEQSAFIQYTGYVLAVLAVWIVARCARSLLLDRREPETWGYLELPDKSSVPIHHWESVLGSGEASDVVLHYNGVERSHAAVLRAGDGSWSAEPLRGAELWVAGKKAEGTAELHSGDRLRLGKTTLRFYALSDAQRSSLQRKRPVSARRVPPAVTLMLLTLFQLTVLFQLCFSVQSAYRVPVTLSFALLFALEWSAYFMLRSADLRGFEPEIVALFLTTVGFAVAATSTPGAMVKQCLLLVGALALFLLLGLWLRDLKRVRSLRWPMAGAAVVFLMLTLLTSEAIWGAKNWLSIAGNSLQPSEFVKIAYIYAGSATLDRLYRRRSTALFILFSAACVGVLALMGDFGTALVFFLAYLVIVYMRSGSLPLVGLSLAGAALAVALVLTLRPYVAARFASWGHVWDDPLGAGYQQVRAMSALAAGGFFGRGAGAGWLKNVVAADTDLVFAVVCEELGLVVGLCCMLAVLLLAVFAVRSAGAGRSSFYVIAACAAVTVYMAQMGLNVFGSLDMLPFTGVTFPFVSRGGSSLIACWGMLAYLKAGDTRRDGSFALRTRFGGGEEKAAGKKAAGADRPAATKAGQAGKKPAPKKPAAGKTPAAAKKPAAKKAPPAKKAAGEGRAKK